MDIEKEITEESWKNRAAAFQKKIKDYDDQIFDKMKADGWKSNGFKERTMTFSWGTVTFSRRQYIKNGKVRTPVDEHFGFEKRQRVSYDVLLKAAKEASKATYRSVQETLWDLSHINISTWTVFKAVGNVSTLLEEREKYRYFEEEYANEKKIAAFIYIDADGVMLHSKQPNAEGKYWKDYAHIALHFGVKRVGKKRYKCVGKKEFFGGSLEEIRQQVIDYVYNHYEVLPTTLVVTNSDGGAGYAPKAMKKLVKELGRCRHEHFWDRYHKNKAIFDGTKAYPGAVSKAVYKAVSKRDFALLEQTFQTMQDTVDSLAEGAIKEKRQDDLNVFRNKFLENWECTASPQQRGIDPHGISFIESSHRKITYRSKNRGMYWSERNAVAIAHLIILSGEGMLDELFHGNWRETYEKYQEVDGGRIHQKIIGESRIRGQQVTRNNLGRLTSKY